MLLDKLKRRIIDISFNKKLSHIGSCLSAVKFIDHIYLIKQPDEPFILDSGHAGLALYTVLEKFQLTKLSAEELFDKHGVHPNRDMDNGIWASSGSLGHGIGIAVGMAIANKDRTTYCLTSDGAMAEGSNWEALRIAGDLRLENLAITVNANGYSALDKTDPEALDFRMQNFYPSMVARSNMFDYPDYLQGVEAHYHVLNEEEYKDLITLK